MPVTSRVRRPQPPSSTTPADDAGLWWARREVKPGKHAPAGYVVEQHDEVTGKIVGWEPVTQSPFAKFHAEALGASSDAPRAPGTYELCGPKVQGNPEGYASHTLVAHADAETFPAPAAPVTPADLRVHVAAVGRDGWEGIVWHHPDGRMAKLKVRDLVRVVD